MACCIYNLEFKSADMCCLQLRQSLVDLCKNLHLTNLQITQIFTVVFENEGGNLYVYIVIRYMHFRSIDHLSNKECVFKIDPVVQNERKQSPLFFNLSHTGSYKVAGKAMYIYK